MQPISARAVDSSNMSKSPEQLMSRLKERLRVTEEQAQEANMKTFGKPVQGASLGETSQAALVGK